MNQPRQCAIPSFELSQLNQVLHLQSSEKAFLAAGGLTLAALVFARRPLLTLGAVATGGYLVYRTVTGHCPISEKLHSLAESMRDGGDTGKNLSSYSRSGANAGSLSNVELPLRVASPRTEPTHAATMTPPIPPQPTSPRSQNTQVDEASKESFPASDPPSYSAGSATPHTQPKP